LQRVGQPVDREPAVVTVEQREVLEHAVGEALAEPDELGADHTPVRLRAGRHRGERRARSIVFFAHGAARYLATKPLAPARISRRGRLDGETAAAALQRAEERDQIGLVLAGEADPEPGVV